MELSSYRLHYYIEPSIEPLAKIGMSMPNENQIMDDPNPICGDGALLLWYAAGALREDDSSRVAEHLSHCSKCQQLLQETEELMQVYRSIPHQETNHPSPENLTAFVEARSPLASSEETRRHVAECDECGEIVQVLRKIHEDESKGGLLAWLRAAVGRVLTRESFAGSGLPSWLASPIPAYLMILLMAYPAYLGLSGLGNLREKIEVLESPALLTSPLPLETDAQRGSGASSVTLRRSSGHDVLTFFVPIASERYRYRIELKRGNESVFTDPDAKSFDGVGTFALLLPQGALPPGDYELVVEELERRGSPDTKQASTVSFSFTLSTQ